MTPFFHTTVYFWLSKISAGCISCLIVKKWCSFLSLHFVIKVCWEQSRLCCSIQNSSFMDSMTICRFSFYFIIIFFNLGWSGFLCVTIFCLLPALVAHYDLWVGLLTGGLARWFCVLLFYTFSGLFAGWGLRAGKILLICHNIKSRT